MITINPTTAALIVVDLQPDFMPGGPLAVAEGDSIVGPIANLAKLFTVIVATQDWHPENHCSFFKQGGPWPPHCVAGTKGARVHPGFPDSLISLKLRKGTSVTIDSYSAFRDNFGIATGLSGYLQERGIERIFVCGLARDYCVKATAVDGAMSGFQVYVLDDLTRAVFPEAKHAVDAEFQNADVRIITSDMIEDI
jgi:nicotinamidase/pyrazinamidase